MEDAFGFDLAPLALKAGEIHAAAERARAEAKAASQLRSEVTLHQRDISKIIEIALEEGRSGDWMDYACNWPNSPARCPAGRIPQGLRRFATRWFNCGQRWRRPISMRSLRQK